MDRAHIGVVAIGRNEGERLRRCLESVTGAVGAIVYVDSGSTDGSVTLARTLGVSVVELDMSAPFTAARARNAGWRYLLQNHPALRAVQFVDGDCELQPRWMDLAIEEMSRDESIAAACGRRRERFPDASAYNRLCDMEWDTPVGPASQFGGDVMIRTRALEASGGYDPSVIAAEDTELAVRLRKAGWTISRIDAEMTLHDAAILNWRQWWRRNLRAGHGFAQGAAMHGAPPLRHWARESRRIWFWGLLLPVLILGLAWPTRGASFVLLGAYLLQAARIYWRERRQGRTPLDARIFAAFMVLSKLPQALGQCTYWYRRLFRRPSQIIEYKSHVDI